MGFCSKCGKPLAEESRFCASCGSPVNVTESSQSAQFESSQQVTNYNDAEQNKGMAIIAYFLFFVPLLTGDHQKSPFVKFHTNQAIILLLTSIVFGAVYSILSVVLVFLGFIFGGFGLLATILSLGWIAILVFYILGIVNAATGQMKPMPFIGDKLTILK